MATGSELNLGKRMSQLYAVPNEALTGDMRNTTNNHDYENTLAVKQMNGVRTYPGPVSSKAANGGTVNEGYNPEGDTERGTKHYENGNFDKQRKLQHKTTAPRKKANAVYEPMDLGGKNETQRQRTERTLRPVPSIVEGEPMEVLGESSGESCISRLVLFFILLIAVVALVLVLLIMLGKIGPNSGCSCGNEGVGASPHTAGSTGSKSSLMLTEIEALKKNVSRAHQRLELRMKQVTDLKVELSVHKLQQNSTLTNLASQDGGIRAAIEKANTTWIEAQNNITSQSGSSVLELQLAHNRVVGVFNIANVSWDSMSNSLSDKVDRTNAKLVSAVQELSSINGTHTAKDSTLQKTIDDVILRSNTVNVSRLQETNEEFLRIMEDLSKVNTTLQKVDTEIENILASVSVGVEAANSSLLDQVKSISQVFQSKDETLSNDLTSVNTTLTAKVGVAEQKPGATGPPGYTGPQGAEGPQGTPGVNGPGDLSSCTHKEKRATPVSLSISAEVPSTQLVMSVSCSGLDARTTSRLTVTGSPPTQYQCNCYNPDLSAATVCVLHYWLCNK